MSSDAEILASRGRLGETAPDPRRWAALIVMLLAGVMNLLWYQVGVFLLAFLLMLALPARRGHSADPASV